MQHCSYGQALSFGKVSLKTPNDPSMAQARRVLEFHATDPCVIQVSKADTAEQSRQAETGSAKAVCCVPAFLDSEMWYCRTSSRVPSDMPSVTAIRRDLDREQKHVIGPCAGGVPAGGEKAGQNVA